MVKVTSERMIVTSDAERSMITVKQRSGYLSVSLTNPRSEQMLGPTRHSVWMGGDTGMGTVFLAAAAQGGSWRGDTTDEGWIVEIAQ